MQFLNTIQVIILIVFSFSKFVANAPVPALEPSETEQVLIEGRKAYEFGYDFGDGLGMSQYRRETADENGVVKGSYGYYDPDGLYRSVEYKADSDGYRVVVKSNEPGMTNQNSADATFIVEPPPPAVLLKTSFQEDPL